MSPSVYPRPHRPRHFSKWISLGLPTFGLAVLWIIYHQAQLLFTSLIISWGLHYFLNPMVDKIEARSISRAVASVMVLIGFMIVGYLIWLRFLTFSDDLRNKVDVAAFQKNLVGTIQQLIIVAEKKAPVLKRYLESSHQFLPERIEGFLWEELFKRIPELAIKLVEFIPNLILIPYFTFFFLKDGRLFKKTMIQWIPNRYFEPALKFFYEMDHRMRSYLQSLLLDCALVGLLIGIGSAMVGTPYPILFGLIAFILNSIPLLGPLLYGSICLLLTIGMGKPTDVILGFTGVFLLSRLCDDLIFTPIIYGRSHHIHPVLVVCMVLLGASIAGAWGMFLAIPITSILFLGLNIIREISVGEEPEPLPRSVLAPFA